MVFIFCVGVYLLTATFLYIKIKPYGVDLSYLACVLLKLTLCIAGLHISLPFTGKDSINFQAKAVDWSGLSYIDILSTLDVTKSYVISSIVAILYKVTEPNLAIPIFMNGILGLLMFFYGIKLADLVWGKRPGLIFAAVLASHAMLNVHSAIFLRENFIGFFILLSGYFFVRYIKGDSVSLFFALLFCLLASFFHGGMLLFSLGLPIFLIFGTKKIGVFKKVFIGCFVFGMAILSVNFMNINKLDAVVEQGVDVDFVSELEAGRQEAGTAYLVGLKPSGIHDMFWQAPVRVVYFLLKPFPWDVKNFGHLLVFLDSLLWLLIMFLAIRNWRTIKQNPAALLLIISCLVTIAAFAYGTGNFGTGVRHRTKFFIMMFAVVSPFLPVVGKGVIFKRRPSILLDD